MVLSNDKTMRFVLIWIAIMLTILAVDKIFQIHMAFAQQGEQPVKVIKKEPLEVVIKGPIDVRLVEWNGYPTQAIKVKIDDPCPARIEIRDEVRVKGELKLNQ